MAPTRPKHTHVGPSRGSCYNGPTCRRNYPAGGPQTTHHDTRACQGTSCLRVCLSVPLRSSQGVWRLAQARNSTGAFRPLAPLALGRCRRRTHLRRRLGRCLWHCRMAQRFSHHLIPPDLGLMRRDGSQGSGPLPIPPVQGQPCLSL